MAWLASDVIRRARALLQDSDTPYRYSDADMLDAINDGVARLLELRPDYFIDIDFAPGVVATTGDTLQVPAPLLSPLAFYVAGTLEMRDDEYADNQRAQILRAQLAADLAGRG